jgi:hypothetical protein
VAAFEPVCLLGVFVCESALPAAFFDFSPVPLLRNVFDAFDAAFLPVVLRFVAIFKAPVFSIFHMLFRCHDA